MGVHHRWLQIFFLPTPRRCTIKLTAAQKNAMIADLKKCAGASKTGSTKTPDFLVTTEMAKDMTIVELAHFCEDKKMLSSYSVAKACAYRVPELRDAFKDAPPKFSQFKDTGIVCRMFVALLGKGGDALLCNKQGVVTNSEKNVEHEATLRKKGGFNAVFDHRKAVALQRIEDLKAEVAASES